MSYFFKIAQKGKLIISITIYFSSPRVSASHVFWYAFPYASSDIRALSAPVFFFCLFRRSLCSYGKSLALSSYRFISVVLVVVVLFSATVSQLLQFGFAVLPTIFRMLVQFYIISVVFCDRVSFFLPNHISIDFSVLNSLCISLYSACKRLLFPLIVSRGKGTSA